MLPAQQRSSKYQFNCLLIDPTRGKLTNNYSTEEISHLILNMEGLQDSQFIYMYKFLHFQSISCHYANSGVEFTKDASQNDISQETVDLVNKWYKLAKGQIQYEVRKMKRKTDPSNFNIYSQYLATMQTVRQILFWMTFRKKWQKKAYCKLQENVESILKNLILRLVLENSPCTILLARTLVILQFIHCLFCDENIQEMHFP